MSQQRGQGQGSGPPDLIELLKKIFTGQSNQTQSASTPPSGSTGHGHVTWFISLAIGILVVLWILSGIFVVSPAEQAVILRWGRYVATVGPGPHWIPRFIDSKYVVDVQQVRNFPLQEEMLTKDENIVSVDLAVQYRVNDPKDFFFNVIAPIKTLQQATSSALRQVVGQMTLDAVLTTGRGALRDRVQTQLEKILQTYQLGLVIADVTLQPVKPPEAVTAAFDDAIKAREDKQSYINKANAYVRQVTSIADGKIARLLQQAQAYQQEVELQAQGDTARYLALLKPYKEHPQVTKERLYLSTISQVLAHTRNVIVENGNNILYMPLQQLLKKQNENFAASSAPTTTASTANKLSSPDQSSQKFLDYGPATIPSYSLNHSAGAGQ